VPFLPAGGAGDNNDDLIPHPYDALGDEDTVKSSWSNLTRWQRRRRASRQSISEKRRKTPGFRSSRVLRVSSKGSKKSSTSHWIPIHDAVDDEVIETAGLLSIRATNPVFQVLTGPIRDMDIIQDPEHSDGAPTIEGTGIRVKYLGVKPRGFTVWGLHSTRRRI
jgi:hypothetical protein